MRHWREPAVPAGWTLRAAAEGVTRSNAVTAIPLGTLRRTVKRASSCAGRMSGSQSAELWKQRGTEAAACARPG